MLPGANFIADEKAAARLLSLEPKYKDVIRPYLTGEDIANDPCQAARRFIVYFGVMTLEQAMEFPEALRLVEIQARGARENSRSYARNPRWWQLLWPRPVFARTALGSPRFLAGTATGKRILFSWCGPNVIASNATNIFALSHDADFGLLSSSVHVEWARAQSSTLEDRIRYTPSSAFETFPWPSGNRDEVADVSRRLYARRSEICVERNIGLTKLYNQLDDGAWADLRDLHRELDEAVAVAYGWPRTVAHDPDETNRRLLELNRAIAAGEVEYDPFR
jgi:hypothetical protein